MCRKSKACSFFVFFVFFFFLIFWPGPARNWIGRRGVLSDGDCLSNMERACHQRQHRPPLPPPPPPPLPPPPLPRHCWPNNTRPHTHTHTHTHTHARTHTNSSIALWCSCFNEFDSIWTFGLIPISFFRVEESYHPCLFSITALSFDSVIGRSFFCLGPMFRLFLARFMSHFGTRRTGTNLDLTRCSHVSITYWIVPFLFYLVLPGFRSRDSILHVRCLRPKNFFSFRGNLQNLRQALVFFSSSFLCVCVCVCVCVCGLSFGGRWLAPIGGPSWKKNRQHNGESCERSHV